MPQPPLPRRKLLPPGLISWVSVWIAVALAGAAAEPDWKRIDALAAESLSRWNAPGCAVAIVHRDRVVFSKGFGVRELGNPAPVTPRTVFAIGSTTKAFTTAAMAILVDEGKMDWDDPVSRHLPGFRLSDPHATSLVTLRDLVSHRTGLSRNDLLWYGSPNTSRDILERIAHVRLNRPFRSAWQYQNIMFLAAGEAVAAASGMTWEAFVDRRIVQPLGMRNTSFTPAAAIANADHATPHRKKEGALKAIPWRNLDNIGPAGSINSNVEDLARWMQMQLAGGRPVIQGKTFQETHTPQMAMRPEDWGRNFTDETNQISYGLGWFLQDYRGHHTVNHGGAIDGFRAQITLLPRDNYGIVVLANLGEANMPEALRWKIVDHLLGLPPKDWDGFLLEREKAAEQKADAARAQRETDRVAGTKPSLPLAEYTGNYRQISYGTTRVSLKGDSLHLDWSSFSLPLKHYHYDVFQLPKGDLEGLVQFRLDARGRVTAVEMLDGNRFDRVNEPAATNR